MAGRTGIPTLQKLARSMCQAIVKFTPVIRFVSDNDPLVISALELALSACGALDQQLDLYRQRGD